LAITVSTSSTWPISRTVVANVLLDNSYPTGGYTLSAATLGMQGVASLTAHPTAGYVFEYIQSTGKLKAFRDATPAAAAPLPEVANATDLSAVTVRVTAHGS
jgi:hypothetical protein